jgi:hypothetical protein
VGEKAWPAWSATLSLSIRTHARRESRFGNRRLQQTMTTTTSVCSTEPTTSDGKKSSSGQRRGGRGEAKERSEPSNTNSRL